MRPAPSKIWIEAASRIAGKECKSFTSNQSFVLDFLWENYPGLYMGSPEQLFSKEDIQQLAWQLSQKSTTAQKKEQFDYLARGFEQGNLTLTGWNVPMGPVFIKINREKNYAKLDRFRPIDHAETLIAEVSSSLDIFVPMSLQATIGQILVSAILFSGLLNRKWTKPFQQNLLNNNIFQEGSLMWVEMTNPPEETGASKLSIEETASAPAFRLPLDHLTRLLVYRYLRLKDNFRAQKIKDPWDNILVYFKEAQFKQNTQPDSLTELINWAHARNLTILPPSLIAYTTGSLPATPLPIGPWLRIVSGEAIPILLTTNKNATDRPTRKPKIIHNNGIQKSEQEQLLSELLKRLSYNKNTSNNYRRNTSRSKGNSRKISPRKARSIIGLFLNENKERLSVTLQLLLHWAMRLLKEKSSHLEHRKKQQLRTTSVGKYLRSFAYELLRVAGDLPLHTLAPQDIETIYEMTIDRITRKRFGILRLRQFHGFLQYLYDAPVMMWTNLLESGGNISSNVNANLISAQTYRLTLETLGFGETELSRWQILHIIAAILLYRCGLRPSEVQALRLIDVQGVTQFEILIRNSIFNDTKTNNGIRRIDISKLISNDELDFFLDFYRKRLAEDTIHGGGLLLTHPIQLDGMLSDEELFDPIRNILRTITEDDTLLLYHLRHTCISWIDTILQMERAQYAWAFPVDGPNEEDMDLVRKMGRSLARNEPWGRKDQYLLAMLAGHSSPEITHRHYCHLLDISLHLNLTDPFYSFPINYRSVMDLTGLQRSMAFKLLKTDEGDHCLQNVVNHEAVKFKGELRHPLMSKAKPLNKIPFHTPSTIIDPWSKSIEALGNDCRLNSIRRSQNEWNLAASFYEAVRLITHDGRRLKTARKVLEYANKHYNTRWGGITYSNKNKAESIIDFIEQCGINKSQIVIIFHPRKNQGIESVEAEKQKWIDALGISTSQIAAGEQAPVKFNARSVITLKITPQDRIKTEQRNPRSSRGFRLAVRLLITALSRAKD